MIGPAFNAFADHPGGWYTWRYFGQHVGGDTVRCAKPGDEHVRSQAHNGCAFWQREAGADCEDGENGRQTAPGAHATVNCPNTTAAPPPQ